MSEGQFLFNNFGNFLDFIQALHDREVSFLAQNIIGFGQLVKIFQVLDKDKQEFRKLGEKFGAESQWKEI